MNPPDDSRNAAGTFAAEHGALPGNTRHRQSITRDWEPLQRLIDGVVVREVRNVPKDNGFLTEVWRADWQLDGAIAQVFPRRDGAFAIRALHACVRVLPMKRTRPIVV